MSLSLTWALHHRPYADYVIKTDADTYVYLPRFIQHLPMPASMPADPAPAAIRMQSITAGPAAAPKVRPPMAGRHALVLVGHAHPYGHYFRDSNTSLWKCPAGDLEGLSGGLLRLLASRGSSSSGLSSGLSRGSITGSSADSGLRLLGGGGHSDSADPTRPTLYGENANVEAEADYSESDILAGLLQPTRPRVLKSRWANSDLDWVERYEDIFLCAIVDRALLRHPTRRLHYRLRSERELEGLWVHSGRLKSAEEYRRCHKGETCRGEFGVTLKRLAVWNASDCGGAGTSVPARKRLRRGG